MNAGTRIKILTLPRDTYHPLHGQVGYVVGKKGKDRFIVKFGYSSFREVHEQNCFSVERRTI